MTDHPGSVSAHVASPASAVNEDVFADRLERLAVALPDQVDLLDRFASFVRPAADGELVRINAVQFAQQHGLPTGQVVELFLHGRKLGLLTMEWQYVCPGCGEIVERLTSLTSASAHYYCQMSSPGAAWSCGALRARSGSTDSSARLLDSPSRPGRFDRCQP